MSIFIQDGIYWYEFTVNRKRYRSSTCTDDRTLALKVEAEHRVSLKLTGKRASATLDQLKALQVKERCTRRWLQAGIETQKHTLKKPTAPRPDADITPASTLLEACEFLLGLGTLRWAPKTMDYNRACGERLIEFFGADKRLSEFKIAHFENYQRARSAICGSSAVNHELQFLSRLLSRADLWYPIKRFYVKLREKEWKEPKIFTEEEQRKIFEALATEPDLELARIVFTLTRNTTASGCELRGLRLKSLELEKDPPRIHVTRDSTKNHIRPRTIPLTQEALDACRAAIARAARLGSHEPNHYLFPLRVDKATWDPTQRTSKSWLTKQVQRLRLVTGIPTIRPHFFRHLAVTELLERGAAEQTVVALAGWASPRMVATYSHTRLEAKVSALRLLGPSGPPTPPAAPAAEVLPPPFPGAGDFMSSLIQAEIARQVAAALQKEREKTSGVIRFPGAG